MGRVLGGRMGDWSKRVWGWLLTGGSLDGRGKSLMGRLAFDGLFNECVTKIYGL